MHGKAVLTGDLGFICLAEVFQILGGNNNTGTLRVTSQYAPAPGLIYFVQGNPINATSGPLSGLDAIYALFGWIEGTFEFHDGQTQVERVVNNSRMEIVLDALRMLDDGLIKKIGPPSAVADSDEATDGKGEVLPIIKGPVVDYMYVIDEEEFRDGDRIVEEGSHGNWIWVILEGTVHLTRETSNGPMTMARFGEGCFIASLACFAQRECVRSATVTAVGSVQLGVLDIRRMADEYSSLSPEFKGLLLSLDGRLRKTTDLTQELFTEKYQPNGLTKDKKLILKEGSSKEDVFVIEKGETHVIRRTAKGYLPLLTLEKGDIFGYVPFMDMGHD
jgi:CRP-like cAMP-binding protein